MCEAIQPVLVKLLRLLNSLKKPFKGVPRSIP
jgi:hypothetical protein